MFCGVLHVSNKTTGTHPATKDHILQFFFSKSFEILFHKEYLKGVQNTAKHINCSSNQGSENPNTKLSKSKVFTLHWYRCTGLSWEE